MVLKPASEGLTASSSVLGFVAAAGLGVLTPLREEVGARRWVVISAITADVVAVAVVYLLEARYLKTHPDEG